MLRRLLSVSALLFLSHLLALSVVYALGFWLPSGGVLDMTAADRRTLTDYGLGLVFDLPVPEAIFSPDRRSYLIIDVVNAPQPQTNYRLRALHTPSDDLLFSDSTGAVRGLPVWSPDGQRIAYLQQSELTSTLVVFRLADRQIETTIDAGYPLMSSLVWWPDGSKLLTAALINGQYDLVTIDRRTGDTAPLTTTPHNETFPLITPDGQTIVFTSSARGTLDVYAMNSDGSTLRPLVAGEAIYTARSLSPDGRWIAIVSLSAERPIEGLRYDLWSGARLPALPLGPAAQIAWW